MTKIEKVRRWLEAGRAITPRQAIARFQYFRLADGILKCRRSGLNVVATLIIKGKVRFAKYQLAK